MATESNQDIVVGENQWLLQEEHQDTPEQQNDPQQNGCCETYYVARILHTIFYFFCSLTGQRYVDFNNQSSWRLAMLTTFSLIGLVTFFFLNLGSLVFDVYVIAGCPFGNSCSFFLHNATNGPQKIIPLDYTQSLGIEPENAPEYEDWKKTVVTTASISGLLSYCFMVSVLIPQYSFLKRYCNRACEHYASLWKWCGEKYSSSSASTGNLLSPFIDGEENDKATHLRPRQTFYFYAIFWFNFMMFIGSAVVFGLYLSAEIVSHNYGLRDLDFVGLAAQFAPQFCAILSCFIFSKVAYAISNKCIAMKDTFKTANVRFGSDKWNILKTKHLQSPPETTSPDLQPQASSNSDSDTNVAEIPQRSQDNSHHAYMTVLKRMDQEYTDMVKASLGPYGRWFSVHWVLYTITAFMAIAYFAETVTQELYTESNVCHHERSRSCRLDLAYILLLTLEHCVLFLYPCFRAASVTAARDILIKDVSEASWNYIPHTVKDSFINYLERQKGGFNVSILCARIQFGYRIAYISIFVGIFGVILKLSF